MGSKTEGRKNALGSVERLLSRNLAAETNSTASSKVSKRRSAATRRAKKLKEKRKVEIEAQIDPESHKHANLWERKRVAAAVTSWDSPDQVDLLKKKVRSNYIFGELGNKC